VLDRRNVLADECRLRTHDGAGGGAVAFGIWSCWFLGSVVSSTSETTASMRCVVLGGASSSSSYSPSSKRSPAARSNWGARRRASCR
jgi:hypothetical protein